MSKIPSNSSFGNTPRILSDLSGFLTSQKPQKFDMSNLRVSDWTDARNKRNLDKALKETKAYEDNFKRIADEKLKKQKEYFDGQAKRQADNLIKLSKQTNKNVEGLKKSTAKQVDNALKKATDSVSRQVEKATQTAQKTVSRQVDVAVKTATKQTTKITAQLSKEVSKVTKELPFLQSLSKSMGGKVPARFGAIIGILGTAATAGITALMVKTQEEIQEINLRTGAVKDASFDKVLDRSLRSATRLKTLQTLIEQVKARTEKLVSDQAKALYDQNQRTRAADKKANDALYEVRAGRQILEAQIERARKPGNDALYEVRQGRQILDARVATADKKANDALFEVRVGRSILEGTINARFANISQSIPSLNNQISSINNQVASLAAKLAQSTANLTTGINNARIESSTINTLKSQIDSLKAQIAAVGNTAKSNSQKIEATTQTANAVNSTVKDLRFGNSWKWEKQIATENKGVTQFVIERTQKIDQEYNKLQAAIAANSQNGQGLLTAINRIDRENAERERQITQQITQQVNQVVTRVINNGVAVEQVAQLQGEINSLKRETTQIKNSIPKIETQIKEQEKMNQEGLKKLDNIAAIAALIPARAGIEAANRITPKIPTTSQISNAAATGVCSTTKPGGCMSKALDNNAQDIKNNANANNNNLLDAIQTVGQGADLALLNTINNKLGDQIDGGISGKLSRVASWLHLDRLLNLLTFAATVHNAVQLSNDIGVTLVGAFNNVLQLIGIKDDKGNNIDIGSVISSSIENLIKGLIGNENYTSLTTAWAKANRIYQATSNTLSSFQNIGHSIINGLEVVGGQQGKVANALRIWGVVGERAYQWMNPQPNYHSKFFSFFEGAQATASTIQQVTQVPLDVIQATTEFNSSTTELIKAIKEEPDKPKGVNVPEAEQTKAAQEAIKNLSQGATIDLSDIFNANE